MCDKKVKPVADQAQPGRNPQKGKHRRMHCPKQVGAQQLTSRNELPDTVFAKSKILVSTENPLK